MECLFARKQRSLELPQLVLFAPLGEESVEVELALVCGRAILYASLVLNLCELIEPDLPMLAHSECQVALRCHFLQSLESFAAILVQF